MALHVKLDTDTPIRISKESNEKLSEILSHPSLERFNVNKRNFVNTLIEYHEVNELVDMYKRALLNPRDTSS